MPGSILLEAIRRISERRSAFPSWSWCAWNFTPTLYLLTWENQALFTVASKTTERNHQAALQVVRAMIADTEISIELEDGSIIPWSGSTAVELARPRSATLNARCLRVRGWISEAGAVEPGLYEFGHLRAI